MTTLREWHEDYLQHLRARNFSAATRRVRGYNVRQFLRWLLQDHGVTTADQLRSAHLRGWQQQLAGRHTPAGLPLKPRSVNKHIEGVQALLRFLADQGAVPEALTNVLTYVKVPQSLPQALAHADVRRLLDSADTTTPAGFRDRTMLELLYSSGLRAAELLSLDVDHIDFANHTAFVIGKGRRERIVPVGVTALRWLESYLRAVRPGLGSVPGEKALFLDRRGRRMPYHTLRRIVLRVAESTGFGGRVTAHVFRRSCTSELIKANANVYHVSRFLGHESLDTLQHYVRLNVSDLRKTHRETHPRERDEEQRGGSGPAGH